MKNDFPDLELHVYGKQPEDLEWVWKKPEEAQYFKECEELIAQFDLGSSVKKHGWVDTKRELSEVAAVISMSDFEGMQVSVAEGYCAGGIGLTLNWRGAEQGYPKEWVFEDEMAMEAGLRKILSGSTNLEDASADGRELIRELYSIDSVWPQIKKLMKSVRA